MKKLIEETRKDFKVLELSQEDNVYSVMYIDYAKWKDKYYKYFESLEKAKTFYEKVRSELYVSETR